MVFKRRQERSFLQAARESVWPAAGYRRTAAYLWHRLSRMQASPHAIALGFACGAFASFTPLIGLHFVLAGLAAWVLRGQILAALLGTAVGNPLTFPFIWAWAYQLGNMILGRAVVHGATDTETMSGMLANGFGMAMDVFVPMLVGGVPAGIIVGIACYFPTKLGIDRYQHARRVRLEGTGGRDAVPGGDGEAAG